MDATFATALEPLTRDDPSDRHLLARIGARDRVAIRELYDIYYRSIASFIAGVTGRPDLVEEMVNDTFMVVWETARACDGEARISTWILGIAYRRGLTCAGNETHAQTETETVLQDPPTSGEATGQVEMVNLDNALRRLPFEQRTVLHLCYRFAFSCEEIAAVMGCPVNTVKAAVLDALRKLRIALRTSGGPPVLGWSQRSP